MSAPRTKDLDLPPGFRRRHATSCPAVESRDMAVCECRPQYQVQAGSGKDRKTKTHATVAAGKRWKKAVEDALQPGESGRQPPESMPRLRAFSERFLGDARAGVALSRKDEPFRESTLRGYEESLSNHVYGEFGDTPLDQISAQAIKDWVKALRKGGRAAQTIRNWVMALRTVLTYAVEVGLLAVSPAVGVKLPASNGRRLKFISPTDIEPMLQLLHPHDRALWATAIYGGLRRGELMELRWPLVDLAAGVIRVEWSYDPRTGEVYPTKTYAGERDVSIAGALRDYLVEHRQRAGPNPRGLVFPRGSLGSANRGNHGDPTARFGVNGVGGRAKRAWENAAIVPVTLQDCRHTFASLMIAAVASSGEFNPKVIQELLGHSSITVTYDRYGHLFPGQGKAAVRLLDAYLEQQNATRTNAVASVQRAAADLVAAMELTDDPVAARSVAQAVRAGEAWLARQVTVRSVPSDVAAVSEDAVSMQRHALEVVR